MRLQIRDLRTDRDVPGRRSARFAAACRPMRIESLAEAELPRTRLTVSASRALPPWAAVHGHDQVGPIHQLKNQAVTRRPTSRLSEG